MFVLFHFIIIFALVSTFIKLIMSQDEKVETHVWYEAFKRTMKIFSTPINKLDEVKAKLNKHFVHLGEKQTCHVIVQLPCIYLGADNDNWENVYLPQILQDDGDVVSMFFLHVPKLLVEIWCQVMDFSFI